MRNSYVRKGLVLGIIVLFVGASVTPQVVSIIISNSKNNIGNLEYKETLYPPWDEFHTLHDCGAWPGYDSGYETGDLYYSKIFVDHGVAFSGFSGGTQKCLHIINWTCPEDNWYTFTFNYDFWGAGILRGMSAFGDTQGLGINLLFKGFNSYPPSDEFYNYNRCGFNIHQKSIPIPFIPLFFPSEKKFNINTPSEHVPSKPIYVNEGEKCLSACISADSYVYALAGSGSVESTIYGRLNYIEIEEKDPQSPILRLSPDPPSYNFGSYYRTGEVNCTFNIWNGGIDELYWSVSSDTDWVDISPSTGTSTGEIDPVLLTINTTDLSLGNNSAEITVHSNKGTRTGIVEMEILNIPPVANANEPYYAESGETITFDASGSIDPDGDIDGYRWDWESDGIWDTDWLSSPTVSHSFPDNGLFLTKLQVKDNDGAESTDFTACHIGINWNFDIIEGTPESYGGGWQNSIAVDSNNHPHVSYVNYFDPNDYTRYAHWDGNQWIIENVDDRGMYAGLHSTSIAVDPNDKPHIAYGYYYPPFYLKYAYKDASGWHTSTVDTDDHTYTYIDIALDSNDYPHIAYRDGENTNTQTYLKYARWNGNTWEKETVPLPGDKTGMLPSIAIDDYDRPHICCYDENNEYIKYARKNTDNSWTIKTIATDPGYRTFIISSIGIDSNNNPHVVYETNSNQLKYVYSSDGGNSWTTPEVIDEDSSNGIGGSALCIDQSNDFIHVSYVMGDYPGSDNLKYALKGSRDGWSVGTVDSNDARATSIAVDNDGLPYISYLVAWIHNLHIATLAEGINSDPYGNAGGGSGRGIYQGSTNETIFFNAAESFDFDGTIDEYRWDWESDGIWDTDWINSSIYTHVYNNTGNYTLKLQVKDDFGSIDDDNATVQIIDINDTEPPSIQDNTGGEAVEGYEFSFIATVTDNLEVAKVFVEYWYDSDSHFNVSIGNKEEDVWEHTIITKSGYQTLHYFISAKDNFDNWAETSIKDVTIIQDEPPYVPSDPDPPNGAENVDTNIILSWTGGDPDPDDTVTYYVCFGTIMPPSIVATGLSATNYDPGELEYSTLYHWQVVAEDNHGVKTYGPIWNFTTKNGPPNTPTIDGPARGKAGTEYDYDFYTTDPESENVYYYIEWGDGSVEDWIGPYNSGAEITKSHTWAEQDTYIIRCKAKDIHDQESDWATLEVTMPKNKAFNFNFPLISWWLERFPNTFPIIRQLIGL